MEYNFGRDLAFLEGGGTSQGAGIWLNYPIIRSRSLNWFFEGGFDAKDVSQKLYQEVVAKDKVRYARIGTSLQWLDTIGGYNVIAIRVTRALPAFSEHGSDLFGHDPPEHDVVYSKVEADVTASSPSLQLSLLLNGTACTPATACPLRSSFRWAAWAPSAGIPRASTAATPALPPRRNFGSHFWRESGEVHSACRVL